MLASLNLNCKPRTPQAARPARKPRTTVPVLYRCGYFVSFWAISAFLESASYTLYKTYVNRGSNPCRGAIPSAYQIHTPIILTAAPAATVARIRHILHVPARRAVSPVGKETARGYKLNPRVEAEPHVFEYQFSRFSG